MADVPPHVLAVVIVKDAVQRARRWLRSLF